MAQISVQFYKTVYIFYNFRSRKPEVFRRFRENGDRTLSGPEMPVSP